MRNQDTALREGIGQLFFVGGGAKPNLNGSSDVETTTPETSSHRVRDILIEVESNPLRHGDH